MSATHLAAVVAASVAVFLTLAAAGHAQQAQPTVEDDFGAARAPEKRIGQIPMLEAACGEAAFWKAAMDKGSSTRACYEPTPERVSAVRSAAETALAALAAELKLRGDASPPKVCALEPQTGPSSLRELEKKATQIGEAQKPTAEQEKRVKAAAIVLEALEKVDAAHRTDSWAAKLAKAKQDLAEGVTLQEVQQKRIAMLEGERKTMLAEAIDEQTASRQEALERLAESAEALVPLDESAGAFEAMIDDPAKRKACRQQQKDFLAVWDKGDAAADGPSDEESDRQAARETERARLLARARDVLRKAPGTGSALGNGNGLLEKPGAPDRVIFSVMSALGAESESDGNQLVTTLNLASVVAHSDAELLKWPIFLRHLFLRLSFPLDKTESKPIVGDDPGTSSVSSVVRYKLLVGSSLIDQADPIDEANDECYFLVHAFRPQRGIHDAAAIERDRTLRNVYYDVCHRRAVNQQRLAWRFGVGLLADNARDGRSRVELIGGALVWAPTSTVYFNALWQRLREPINRDSYGGGLSIAENVGGSPSGIFSWARVGVDMLLLGVKDKGSDTTLEGRASLTVRAKVSDSSFITFSVGPRFVGKLDDPGVLATVGVTYDADQLIDPLLNPPIQPAPSAAP